MSEHEHADDGEHGHADDDEDGHDHGAAAHSHEHPEGLERVTSPMQEYDLRQVGVGVLVLAVGLLVTFALPLLVA